MKTEPPEEKPPRFEIPDEYPGPSQTPPPPVPKKPNSGKNKEPLPPEFPLRQNPKRKNKGVKVIKPFTPTSRELTITEKIELKLRTERQSKTHYRRRRHDYNEKKTWRYKLRCEEPGFVPPTPKANDCQPELDGELMEIEEQPNPEDFDDASMKSQNEPSREIVDSLEQPQPADAESRKSLLKSAQEISDARSLKERLAAEAAAEMDELERELLKKAQEEVVESGDEDQPGPSTSKSPSVGAVDAEKTPRCRVGENETVKQYAARLTKYRQRNRQRMARAQAREAEERAEAEAAAVMLDEASYRARVKARKAEKRAQAEAAAVRLDSDKLREALKDEGFFDFLDPLTPLRKVKSEPSKHFVKVSLSRREIEDCFVGTREKKVFATIEITPTEIETPPAKPRNRTQLFLEAQRRKQAKSLGVQSSETSGWTQMDVLKIPGDHLPPTDDPPSVTGVFKHLDDDYCDELIRNVMEKTKKVQWPPRKKSDKNLSMASRQPPAEIADDFVMWANPAEDEVECDDDGETGIPEIEKRSEMKPPKHENPAGDLDDDDGLVYED
ncbi:unnamed protein product, partial [Mesorhabditis spiculigera]